MLLIPDKVYYIDFCQRGVAAGTISQGHTDGVIRYLNELCRYCGALPVAQLKKGHVKFWIETHPSWRSPVTQRNVLTIVLAAFNQAQQRHAIPNPLRGLKKPPPRPRLHSLSPQDEQALYGATVGCFGDFFVCGVAHGSAAVL